MNAVPCALCGYDAPGSSCPHCDLQPTGKGLGKARSRGVQAMVDGLIAVPHGFLLLMKTRGVKRWLVPPVVLTSVLFLGLFVLAMNWVDALVDDTLQAASDGITPDANWFADFIIALLQSGAGALTAKAIGLVSVIVTSSIVALYTFSIAYEAIAGPFLDEIQGKLEEGWFGSNPRNKIHRPTEIPVKRCVRLTLIAGVPAIVLVFAFALLHGTLAWVMLFASTLPFVVVAVLDREYGAWLRWVVSVESGTLWVSVKASLLALLILAFFFPLKFFFPPFGFLLFFAIAGFSTAITLLDIPFSRRQWAFRDRLRFIFSNLLPMTAYGAVSSLVFLVPVIGPIVLVPAASIGGLWLVCRLDKSNLRPEGAPELSSTGRNAAGS